MFIRVEENFESGAPGYVNTDKIRHMAIRELENLGFTVVLYLDSGTDIYDRYDTEEDAEQALCELVNFLNGDLASYPHYPQSTLHRAMCGTSHRHVQVMSCALGP